LSGSHINTTGFAGGYLFTDPKVIKDFLPRPEELAFREEGVKVTIALSKKSVKFFKSEAAKHHTQYQRMIRRLIDTYVETYNKP